MHSSKFLGKVTHSDENRADDKGSFNVTDVQPVVTLEAGQRQLMTLLAQNKDPVKLSVKNIGSVALKPALN